MQEIEKLKLANNQETEQLKEKLLKRNKDIVNDEINLNKKKKEETCYDYKFIVNNLHALKEGLNKKLQVRKI